MTILQDKIREFNIPTVKSHNSVADPQEFISFVRGLIGEEGFVVAWDSGHRVKCKSEDYMIKHKAKDMIGREKNVIEIIANEQADDVRTFLDAKDLARFEEFENKFWNGVRDTSLTLIDLRIAAAKAKLDVDRKIYAVEFVQKQEEKYQRFLYKMFDQKENTYELVKGAIAKSCSTQTKVDEVRWLFNCHWIEQGVEE
jgi:RNA ligase